MIDDVLLCSSTTMLRLRHYLPSFRSYHVATLLRMVRLLRDSAAIYERTAYTPQGMSAEVIFAWASTRIEQVEQYIERKNAEREKYGGEGLVSSRRTFEPLG